MAHTKKDDSKVVVGNISGVGGDLNIAAGSITTHHTTTGVSAAEMRQLFDRVYASIEANAKASPAEKADLKVEVQEIQSTVAEAAQASKQLDEGFVSRRFRNIARMAPDVLDVVVAALANPLAGLGVAAGKIAERAKAETKPA